MKRVLKALALVSIGGVVIAFLSLVWFQAHSQQLWRVVNQRCLSQAPPHGKASPCLRVDRLAGYVVFNDKHGPLHTLLIPSAKVSGIESPDLLSDHAKDYFHFAWSNRDLLKQQADVRLADPLLALAINSYYGRTQNQLHIHLACLKPEIYQQITAYTAQIDRRWRVLPFPLAGHQYWTKEIDEGDNPVKVLAQWVQSRGGKMADYGLVRIVSDRGRVILLASQAQWRSLNRGSVESLMDNQCHLAKKTQAREGDR